MELRQAVEKRLNLLSLPFWTLRDVEYYTGRSRNVCERKIHEVRAGDSTLPARAVRPEQILKAFGLELESEVRRLRCLIQ